MLELELELLTLDVLDDELLTLDVLELDELTDELLLLLLLLLDWLDVLDDELLLEFVLDDDDVSSHEIIHKPPASGTVLSGIASPLLNCKTTGSAVRVPRTSTRLA